MNKQINAVILGASGYTGVELVRLLLRHDFVAIRALTANSHAGELYDRVFPHLGFNSLPGLIKNEEIDWDGIDVAFCALPHGATQNVIKEIPEKIKVIDLSADFRLDSPELYSEWYGHVHFAPELQKEAVYGLTEFYRNEIIEGRLVACPGCYPTAALIQLLPLVQENQIDADDIIIDAKSGVTGAGRSLKETSLFSEVAEGIHPYGVAHHRHAPEIEQEITKSLGRQVIVNFTPHLMPMNRGELVTTYVRCNKGISVDDIRQNFIDRYKREHFIRTLDEGVLASTRHVRGSNFVVTSVIADRIKDRVILITAIDNLVKGSSGQAIQNMNLMFGFDEIMGLEQEPLFP
ncbi:MAG: N-acetyl-gamma-glutamyl-phosphate reductase [Alphaproteobacteria bacterium MarineAlpha12_Bin1]|nr:MAG: N-acetyl-gamma-glutamyl-phosphate reductase [Alphaproteobacteria bacterium MarineAlpha12_Bin1]